MGPRWTTFHLSARFHQERKGLIHTDFEIPLKYHQHPDSCALVILLNIAVFMITDGATVSLRLFLDVSQFLKGLLKVTTKIKKKN